MPDASKWEPYRAAGCIKAVVAGLRCVGCGVPTALVCSLRQQGTFLYASCIHILPEVVGERGRLGMGELSAVIGGCVVPIIVAAVQGEHHH